VAVASHLRIAALVGRSMSLNGIHNDFATARVSFYLGTRGDGFA
jgi:hypothetical protein